MEVYSAQHNMIEQQIRPWDVMSPKVLEVFAKVSRADFVLKEYKDLAYMDMQLPIGEGQVMLEPRVEARMLQALAVESTDVVLEIGTGSGFMTALLASLGAKVDSMEIFASLSAEAGIRLQEYDNVQLEVANALNNDFMPKQSYDVLVLTGAVSHVPDYLRYAVREGGRLFAFVTDEDGITSATLMHRVAARNWQEEKIFEAEVSALQYEENAPVAPFVF